MKHTVIFLLLFFPLTVLSQVNIRNLKLIDPDMNMLYIGFDNKIEISGINVDTTVLLTSSSGEAKRLNWDTTKFIVRVRRPGTDTLKLYKDSILILQKIFQIKIIGNPVAYLGNISDTIVSTKEIISNPQVNAFISDCYYDHRYYVYAFELSVIKSGDTTDTHKKIKIFDTFYDIDPKTGETKKIFKLNLERVSNKSSSGNQLTKKQLKHIKRLKNGDKVIIHKIAAGCADCRTRRLQPIILTIKEE